MKYRLIHIILLVVAGFLISKESIGGSMVAQWNFDSRNAESSLNDQTIVINVSETALQREDNEEYFFVLNTAIDDTIERDDLNVMRLEGSFGGSFWIKTSSEQANAIMDTGQILRMRSADGFTLQVVNGAENVFAEFIDPDQTPLAQTRLDKSSMGFAESDWNHVAFSLNFTVECFELALYVNNQGAVQSLSDCSSYANSSINRFVQTLSIGGTNAVDSNDATFSDNKWEGLLDDIRLYQVSLTDNEVTCLEQKGTICVLGDQRGAQGPKGEENSEVAINGLTGGDELSAHVKPGAAPNGSSGNQVTAAYLASGNTSAENLNIQIDSSTTITIENVTPSPERVIEHDNLLIQSDGMTPIETGNLTILLEDNSSFSLSGLRAEEQDDPVYRIGDTNYPTSDFPAECLAAAPPASCSNSNTNPLVLEGARGDAGVYISGVALDTEDGDSTVFTLSQIGNIAPNIDLKPALLTKGAQLEGREQTVIGDQLGRDGEETQISEVFVGREDAAGYDYYIPVIVGGMAVILPPDPEENTLLTKLSNGQMTNLGTIEGEDSNVDGSNFVDKWGFGSSQTVTHGDSYSVNYGGGCSLLIEGINPVVDAVNSHSAVNVTSSSTGTNQWRLSFSPATYVEEYSIYHAVFQMSSGGGGAGSTFATQSACNDHCDDFNEQYAPHTTCTCYEGVTRQRNVDYTTSVKAFCSK